MTVCGWDWGAIAGFVAAGVGAVVGGIQALIYRQQRDIQKRANDQALFDRRYIAYHAVGRMLYFATDSYRYVSYGDNDCYENYITSKEIAPFIFSKNVVDFIDALESKIQILFDMRKGGVADVFGNSLKSDVTADELEIIKDLKQDYESLGTIFREMKLT